MRLFCALRWDGARLRHAACRASCRMRRACRCRLLLLHLLCCTVSAARCMAHVGRCRRPGATARRARVQLSGGVLVMSRGDATFESVAISDTFAAIVRVAWRGRPGPEAEWGGGLQDGGVVAMDGGSVRFKGGSIARSTAVRGPLR